MNFARVKLIIALVAFLGWLSYLGYAVWYNTFHKPTILSRAQLSEAVVLVTAEVTTDAEGLARQRVKVAQRLSKDGPTTGEEITIENLPSAQPPGLPFPGAGVYLLPLVPQGAERTSFRLAGLPRSPGYPAAQFVRPVLYPWSEAVQIQLRNLGYQW
jgi:hypothetical protein